MCNRYLLDTQRWTCCDQPGAADPCSGAYEHIPRMQTLTELSKLYQFHSTPLVSPKQSDVRPAVAIDCEMGTAVSGDSELIRLTLIDYFSGAVLIDKIVEPDVPMLHLNTKYSGVSWAVFNRARRQGISLKGKGGARRAVWKYVGADTIVIGHGITNDLRALRWIHTLVADSMIVETGRMKRKEAETANEEISAQGNLSRSDTAVEGLVQRLTLVSESQSTNISPSQLQENTPKPVRVRKPGKLALKTLAKQYLGRDIQTNERKGHDSLEDAIAARDLIHWNVIHPEQ
jgi:RNA exonuclease 1